MAHRQFVTIKIDVFWKGISAMELLSELSPQERSEQGIGSGDFCDGITVGIVSPVRASAKLRKMITERDLFVCA